MRIAATADGSARRATPESATQEYRCLVCSRQLVLRSGPLLAPHFAHRPRQSCAATRRGPSGAGVPPRPPVQLRLFELDGISSPPVQTVGSGDTPGPPNRERGLWARLARWFRRRRPA